MIYHIHQQTGFAHYKKIKNLIKKIYSQLQEEYVIIIADNLEEKNNEIENEITLKSDNNFREFSGWNVGFKYVKSKTTPQDLTGIVFTNDTILRHRAFDEYEFLGIIEGIKDAKSNKDPVYLGHVDKLKKGNKYGMYVDEEFISTYFLFMNKVAYELTDRLFDDSIAELFSNTYPEVFNYDKYSYCNDYLQEIENWVHKPNDGKKWYGHELINKENYEKLKLKCHSVVIEHNISLRFKNKNGGKILSLNNYIKRSICGEFKYKIMKISYSIKWRTFKFFKIKW